MENDDDFALAVYEMQEQRMRAVLKDVEEATERWWIVLHTRVAVRPAPSTEGKPLCVLPLGSVVRATGTTRVDSQRWVRIHDDDLLHMRKKEQPPPKEAYMLTEAAAAGLGTLLMVAPKEFDWETLADVAPKHRGERARQAMLTKATAHILDASDADIEALLGSSDRGPLPAQPPPAAVPAPPAQPLAAVPAPPAAPQRGFREFSDGLLEPRGEPQATRTYDEIMSKQAATQRRKNAQEAEEEERIERERVERERCLMTARLERLMQEHQGGEAPTEARYIESTLANQAPVGKRPFKDPWWWK